jgi:hypothetical protein
MYQPLSSYSINLNFRVFEDLTTEALYLNKYIYLLERYIYIGIKSY